MNLAEQNEPQELAQSPKNPLDLNRLRAGLDILENHGIPGLTLSCRLIRITFNDTARGTATFRGPHVLKAGTPQADAIIILPGEITEAELEATRLRADKPHWVRLTPNSVRLEDPADAEAINAWSIKTKIAQTTGILNLIAACLIPPIPNLSEIITQLLGANLPTLLTG